MFVAVVHNCLIIILKCKFHVTLLRFDAIRIREDEDELVTFFYTGAVKQVR